MTEIVWMLSVILAAALLRGFSGFGFSLATVPLLAPVYGMRATIPLILVIEFLNAVPLLGRLKKAVDFRLLAPLSIGAIIALPLGLLALSATSPTAVVPLVSILVLISVALLWRGPSVAARFSRSVFAWPTGIISGFLNGFAGMSGPPVILYMLSGATGPEAARSTMLAFFPLTALVTVAAGITSGVYAMPSLWLVLAALPISMIGTEVGIYLGRRTSPDRTRKFSLGLLALGAAASLSTQLFHA